MSTALHSSRTNGLFTCSVQIVLCTRIV